MGQEELTMCRSKIDALDAQLLEVLNRRAQVAQELGALKRRYGLPLCDLERESAVLAKALENNPGPLEDASVLSIFQHVIRECRRVQDGQASVQRYPETGQASQGVNGNDHQYE
ncbi:MAG TPA: chorismate mutase [Terriglobales bacterium]|nr:chorismate mutase [Terriglobales bacterium]